MAIKWNTTQETLACLLAKMGASAEAIKRIAKVMEIDYSALNMRVSNHKKILNLQSI